MVHSSISRRFTERCGQSHPACLEIHHRHGTGSLHAIEPDRQALSLGEWVVREEDPRGARYAVMPLCPCCRRIEHAGV